MKIAIIGGGAAGLMSVATLLEEGVSDEIHLFEKNEKLGIKVSISGGGRCNVTTGINDINDLLKNYTRGKDFIKPCMQFFPPRKVIEWFNDHGLQLKTQSDNRVFPLSDRGQDVVDLFEFIFKNRVKVHLSEPIVSLKVNEDNKFHLMTNEKLYVVDIVVIASGGNAYSHTGSSGDGYNFAKSCGHGITALGPSLNSFEVKEAWCKRLQGIALENAALKVTLNDQKIIVSGSVLFTHFGITGPGTFSLSSQLSFEEISNYNPYQCLLIPIHNMDYDRWNSKLLEDFKIGNTKQVRNIISKYFPKRFANIILDLCEIDPEKTASNILKDERKLLCKTLGDGLIISLVKRRAGDEFVTAGGVDISEVDRKTMKSKIINNLYFAGEVLNVDGLTGGFNLQFAWASGRLAGYNIAKAVKKR